MLERALSISLLPLILVPMFIGPNPISDFALGLVLPIHCHLGFSAIITDYLPKRKFNHINTISVVTLYVITMLSMYGCYEYNTNSIGMTALVGKIWTEA